MAGQDDDSDGKVTPFNQMRIRRGKKHPLAEMPPTAHSGMLASIGKRLRIELNSDTTPMPLRILLVALRLMPPETPAPKSGDQPTTTPPSPNATITKLPRE